MTKLFRNITFILLLTFSAISVFGATVDLRVAPSVAQGNRFRVTIVVKNGNANVSRDDAPQLPGCTLINGPGKSTMVSSTNINGQQSSSTIVEYTFTYVADKQGRVTVPPIRVSVDGKSMSTPSKSFNVTAPDQAGQIAMNNRGNQAKTIEEELEDLINGRTRPQPQQAPHQPQVVDESIFDSRQITDNKYENNDFMVRINLSKENVYEKEAVVATVKLYTKHGIVDFKELTKPQFDGFLSEQIDMSNQQPQIETLNGTQYNTFVLKKTILYPQKSGTLTINSGTYDVTLQIVNYVQHGYLATGYGTEKKIQTSSNSVSIHVKPLPTPIPPSFNGAVGHFTVSSKLVPDQLRTNEEARYVLTLEGTGNIMHLIEPTIPLPATVDEYQPTGKTDASFTGTNMQGSYTATYSFVPQQEGELTIPSWEFTYFNPESGQYVTTKLPSYTRKVAKGSATSGSLRGKSGAIDTDRITDIRHIMKVDENSLSRTPRPYFLRFGYWLAFIVIIVIFVAGSIAYRRYTNSLADVQGRRIRKARSVATKRLRNAREAMTQHKTEQFYANVVSALCGFLGDKLKMPASSLTRDNIADTLAQAGASDDVITETINLLDECEMARFTPMHSDNEMSVVYEKASVLIDKLNRLNPSSKKTDIRTIKSRYAE